ncbi:MAG: LLM class flavin-dependent oxidoreductase [Candidatus Tectomicrobia bacterium]|nr:LLM class flavin-dependent oxidoreductase [Candidatus Tectomicrobia bacterium]
MARKLSIGFNWQGPLNWKEACEKVHIADEIGVDIVWMPEAWGRDCFTPLALFADKTRRIKLGTAIVNIYSRTPSALAQHFATLDDLSEGRMIIGLGTSGPLVIEHWHGIPFKPSLTRMREYIEIINTIISGRPLNYHGKLFKLERGFTLRFQPFRPHIPVYIASLTPKSVQQTAQIADGWLPTNIPIEKLADEVKAFREMVRAAGRDPNEVVVRASGGVTVTNNEEEARQEAKSGIAFYVCRMGNFYYDQLVRLGYKEAVDKIRAAWAEGGHNAGIAAVPDRMLDALQCIGSVEACRDRLAQQDEAGVDLHSVSVKADTLQEVGRILEQLMN